MAKLSYDGLTGHLAQLGLKHACTQIPAQFYPYNTMWLDILVFVVNLHQEKYKN